MEGMSGQRYRVFVNTLMRKIGDDARYLEIGSWKGSTLAAAIEGNNVRAVAIDNWSQFGGPKAEFAANIASVETVAQPRFIEADFRKVDYGQLGPFNVFLFDGPHEEHDQFDGIAVAQPALENPHILIVDDWNWRQVRIGTLRAITATGWRLAHAVEIRTTHNDTHPAVQGKDSDWHNGYFVALLQR